MNINQQEYHVFIINLSFLLVIFTSILSADIKNLTLNQAMRMLDANNLELKISRFSEQMKEYEQKAASGQIAELGTA